MTGCRTATVSMTTTPARLPFLAPVLDRLLDQTFTGFALQLHIPEVCRRTNRRYELPAYLTRYAKRLAVCPADADYGPATKLLGPFARRSSIGDLLITVDDDVLLERHAIEELVAAAARFPSDAIGFMGVSSGQFVHAESLAERGLPSASVGLLGGYRGVLYPASALDQSILSDYRALSRACEPFLDDDHLFSWNLARRGISRTVIATKHSPPGPEINAELLNLPDPIHFGSDGGAAVRRSHLCLTEYYKSNGWDIPA
jgi:hypothetical protein